MKILLSIFINALILFIIAYILSSKPDWIIVTWWLTTYLTWWIVLWIINVTIKPILKLLSIPLFFLFFWLSIFLVNWIILKLLNYIMSNILAIPWVSYNIVWNLNLFIAVIIFTILNILFNIVWLKK